MACDTLKSFQAAQRVLADVTGIKVVHGVTPLTSGDGANSLLRPATNELADSPAIVLGSGPIAIKPGPVANFTWTIQGGIWRIRDPYIETAYDGLVGDIGLVYAAVAAKGKAYAIQAELQSLKVVSFAAIDGMEWPAESNRWFLVAPFELEVVIDYDTPTLPA